MATTVEILNNIEVRTLVLNSLETSERIKVSRGIERYQKLLSERVKIAGKTYGSTRYQNEDAVLVSKMRVVRESIDLIISNI